MLERILIQLIVQYGFALVRAKLEEIAAQRAAMGADLDAALEIPCDYGAPFPEEQLTCRPSSFRKL